MNTQQTVIYQMLQNEHKIQGIKHRLETQPECSPDEQQKQIALLDELLNMIDSWMDILTDEERFVIKRHIMDGLPWECVLYEYNHVLNQTNTKSYSSLRRIQNKALERMICYTKHQQSNVEYMVTVKVT